MNRGWIILTSILLAVSVFCPPAWSEDPTVAVVYDADTPMYRNILDTIRSRSFDRGYSVRSFQLEKNDDPNIMSETIQPPRYQLVIGIGTKGATVAKMTNLPGLFLMVPDPQGAGLVDEFDTPTGSLTGISMGPDFRSQFDIILQVLPTLGRVGLVFDKKNSDSQTKSVVDAGTLKGIFVDSRPIESGKEAVATLGTMKEDIGLIWALPDQTIFEKKSTTKKFMAVSLKNKIPMICYKENLLNMGALICFLPNFDGVGEQAYTILESIVDGMPPQTIALAQPQVVSYKISQKAANFLGITLPESVLEKAKDVVK